MNLIDIGPECFTDEEANVISYKGENYYRACGAFVHQYPDGGSSSCVKRVGHQSVAHEDYHGRMISDGDVVREKAETP